MTPLLLLALVCPVASFAPPPPMAATSPRRAVRALQQADNKNNEARMKEIMAEEALNAESLKASAEQMKNMKPADIDNMIRELDAMPAAQKAQLEAMGMDPDMMKSTMKMMKENPEMIEATSKLMESMTPEEILQQSRVAQENLKNMDQMSTMSSSSKSNVIADAEIVSESASDDEEEDEDEDEEEDSEPIELDPQVLDSMFRVAELMSEPPEGGVTFPAFATVPPIALLTGTADDDISKKELTECWNKGSLGATRVDRNGFERVWAEVQEYFYSDIVEEARERTLVVKKKRGSSAKSVAPQTTASVTGKTPLVGASISPEELSNQVKNMKDEDLSTMFDQMSNMTPEQEARMKAMGVDVEMMKKSASVMKSNPLLRKAATMMMKNASPEQLMKASQEAQEKMANMTDEEKKKMMENMK